MRPCALRSSLCCSLCPPLHRPMQSERPTNVLKRAGSHNDTVTRRGARHVRAPKTAIVSAAAHARRSRDVGAKAPTAWDGGVGTKSATVRDPPLRVPAIGATKAPAQGTPSAAPQKNVCIQRARVWNQAGVRKNLPREPNLRPSPSLSQRRNPHPKRSPRRSQLKPQLNLIKPKNPGARSAARRRCGGCSFCLCVVARDPELARSEGS